MTYIIPKSFHENKIYINQHKNIHKIYYSLKNLRLMGIPLLLSKNDYECKNGRIYLLEKEKIKDLLKIDSVLSEKLDDYSSLIKRNLNGYCIQTNYKYMNEPKNIYLCIYKIVNNIPQIYIVEDK